MWSLHLVPLDLSPHKAWRISAGRPKTELPNSGPAIVQTRSFVRAFKQAFWTSAAKTSRSSSAASVNATRTLSRDATLEQVDSDLPRLGRQIHFNLKCHVTIDLLAADGCSIVIPEFKSRHDVLHLLFPGFCPEVSLRLTINRKGGSD
jgi:hypothetical protein